MSRSDAPGSLNMLQLLDALIRIRAIIRKLRPALVHELNVARRRRLYVLRFETGTTGRGLLRPIGILRHLVDDLYNVQAFPRYGAG